MELTVVIPVHNEAECIDVLCRELWEELPRLRMSYEVICVDDGSRDNTKERIAEICKRYRNFHGIIFTRRFGLSAALAAGFRFAHGEVIISMDGDLQNDPKDITALLIELQRGYDVVCGYRKERCDRNWSRRFPSYIANRVGRMLFGLKVHDFSSTMRAYRSEAVKVLAIFNGAHRFIPVLAKRNELSISEIIISHRLRTTGVSKYNLINRILKVIKDALMIKFCDLMGCLGINIRWKTSKFEIKEII